MNTIDTTTDGRVWAGTADGLIPFSRDARGWQPSPSRLPVRGATAVRGASTGGLWVSTTTALYRVQGSSVVQIPAPRTAKPLSIEALATDAGGEAWIVTSSGEVMRTGGGPLRLEDQVPELRGVRTNAALVDRNGHLWVSYAGTRIGVVNGPGDFRTFGDSGLGTGPHYDMYEDPSGTIWICGADGLSRLTGDRFTLRRPRQRSARRAACTRSRRTAGTISGWPLRAASSASTRASSIARSSRRST